MSREEDIVRTVSQIQDPMSRRVFMQLATAAGISLPMGTVLGMRANQAFAAPTGKAATCVATLANDYWAAFIKSGNPGSAGGPAWPKFTAATEASMEFGADGPTVREHHLAKQLDWTEQGLAK